VEVNRFVRCFGVAVLFPVVAAAQSAGLDPDHDLPVWMRAWSALSAGADLPRRLPGAGTATSALFFGAPRVGTFWTAGNPAGLVADVRDSRSDFGAAYRRQSGEYRRPLDPGAAKLMQVSGQSWRGFSNSVSLLGRVSFDQERYDPGTRADMTDPFSSGPLVTTDTSGAPVRRTRAMLEGVAGWRSGRWSVGVSAGYEARENSSILATVTRRDLLNTPAAVLGVSRGIGGTATLGVYGRFRHRSETIRLIPGSGATNVYDLQGYSEVTLIGVLINPYYRRREENARSFGFSLDGGSRNRWTVYAQTNSLHDRQWRQQSDQPPKDAWDATGWTAGGAVQRPLGASWLATLHARAVSLSGEADLAQDTLGVFFTADESLLELEAELRRVPDTGGWLGVLTVGFDRQSRNRRDLAAKLETRISSGSPWVGVEVGHTVSGRLSLSVGGAIAAYGPTSALPDPALQGPVYQVYVAPEVDLFGRTAHPTAFSLLARYRTGGAGFLWLSSRTEHLSPSGAALSSFSPSASRSSTFVSMGVSVEP
jgi:hypothetical protein